MTVAILGLGNMGKGLARRLAGNTDLILASRNEAEARAFAGALAGNPKVVVGYEAAVAEADIVVLALPYGTALDVVRQLDLSGKTVVDITNPLNGDFSGLVVGHTTSAAEELQKAAPAARVVKAYNTIFAPVFDLPAEKTRNIPAFLAGDDEAAVAAVATIVEKSGFAVQRTGGLASARFVEGAGMLNVLLGYGQGLGQHVAPTWARLEA